MESAISCERIGLVNNLDIGVNDDISDCEQSGCGETKDDVSVLDLTVHCEPSLVEQEDLVEEDYSESIGLEEDYCVDPLEFLEVDQLSNTEGSDSEHDESADIENGDNNQNSSGGVDSAPAEAVAESPCNTSHDAMQVSDSVAESVDASEPSEDSEVSEYNVDFTDNLEGEDVYNRHSESKPRRPRLRLPICEACGYLKKDWEKSLDSETIENDYLKNNEVQIFCDCASDRIECKICSKAIKYSCYPTHLRRHKTAKKYVCDTCGKVFQHPIHYRNHIVTHLPGQDIYCDICKRSFKMLKSLRHHQMSCKSKKFYKCVDCAETFPLKRLLVDHLKVHEKKLDVEETFNCEICCIVFDNSSSKKEHIMEVHVAAQRFVCSTCGEAFVTECAMRRHTKSHNRSFPCKACGRDFRTRKDLLTHRMQHRSIKDLRCKTCGMEFEQHADYSHHKLVPCCVQDSICDICSKPFRDKNSLRKHLLTHTPISERCITCDMCKRNFSGPAALKKHIRLIHSDLRPYTCEFCSKSFNQLCKLKYHIITHSSDKPVSCEICNKAFGNDKDIKIHMRTHTGERPFKCNLCGKTFRQRGHVKTHQIVHTKERPFNCQLCDKRFGLPSSLKKHMKLHASRVIISSR